MQFSLSLEDIMSILDILKEEGKVVKPYNNAQVFAQIQAIEELTKEERYTKFIEFVNNYCNTGFNFHRYLSAKRGGTINIQRLSVIMRKMQSSADNSTNAENKNVTKKNSSDIKGDSKNGCH